MPSGEGESWGTLIKPPASMCLCVFARAHLHSDSRFCRSGSGNGSGWMGSISSFCRTAVREGYDARRMCTDREERKLR